MSHTTFITEKIEKYPYPPGVCIVILNWNDWKNTISCIESLSKVRYPNYNIIIVDNASQDNSVEKITEWIRKKTNFEFAEITKNDVEKKGRILKKFPRVVLIKNDKNYGAPEGFNIGISLALSAFSCKYILRLDNDVVLTPDFLDELVNILESDEGIGIVGPKIFFWNLNGRKDIIWFAGGKADINSGKFYHYRIGRPDKSKEERIKEVDFITGCCMLIRRDVFQHVGLFDKKYFIYCEDIDFCLRAKRAGFKIVYVPTSVIWHKVSTSGGGAFNPRKAYFKYRGMVILIRKFGRLNIKNLVNVLIDSLCYSYGTFKTNKKDFIFSLINVIKGTTHGIKLTLEKRSKR